MLNNFLAKALVGLASIASTASAFNLEKRFANSSSTCETRIETQTSIVSVYGAAYTGVPSNQYSVPTAIGIYGDSDITFDVYVPQSVYNLAGLDLILESVTGGSFNVDSFVLYTGDIDNFVNPVGIYSSSENGLEFDGRTEDPLLKISITGTHQDGIDVFVGNFVLELDVIPAGAIVKRDVLTISLEATASKDATSATTSSSTASTASSAESTTESTTGSSVSSSESITSSSDDLSASSSITSVSSGASSTATNGETVVLSDGETVVIGSTITKTITSCSDNKCSEHEVTAVGGVIVATVNEVVTSYTTYCPVAVDVPNAKTVASVNQTVTIGTTVTIINTTCPVISGKVEKTLTGTSSDSVFKTVVTITDFVSVTGTPAVPTATPTATASASTSEGAEQNIVSVYNGAAARSNIAGGVLGVFALVMML